MRSLLTLLILVLAGCAGTPGQEALDAVAAAAPEPLYLPLGQEDCYSFNNIPFTDVGWPNQYLPPGYTAADASSVWGFPVNVDFSAMGIGVFGCQGDEPWQIGVLHTLVAPPAVPGLEPVHPTSTPSPFTAVDGGFNFYVHEWYASGALYDVMTARGWNVINATFDIELPSITRQYIPGPEEVGSLWYTPEDVSVKIVDGEGERTRFDNQLEILWNHRNFEFVLYHDTPNGTGALQFTTGPEHLLVGRGTCTSRPDTLAHEIFTNMPYLGVARQRSGGDCPDDGLGAFWTETDVPVAAIRDLPGVHAG